MIKIVQRNVDVKEKNVFREKKCKNDGQSQRGKETFGG